ncbi:hypothetical protein I5N59_24570 [Serratia marcescens]|uniref:hypothetical protein n=1 Tax=Serratia marcescens TaxID=615 RepID=UPI0018D77EC6|nr:hypothetical protein [Serratia marcescens]
MEKPFAELLNIEEGELVHALHNGGMLMGRKLPNVIKERTGKSRRFFYEDVIAFIGE